MWNLQDITWHSISIKFKKFTFTFIPNINLFKNIYFSDIIAAKQ